VDALPSVSESLQLLVQDIQKIADGTRGQANSLWAVIVQIDDEEDDKTKELKKALQDCEKIIPEFFNHAKLYVEAVEEALADQEQDVAQVARRRRYGSVATYLDELVQSLESSKSEHEQFQGVCESSKAIYRRGMDLSELKEQEANDRKRRIERIGSIIAAMFSWEVLIILSLLGFYTLVVVYYAYGKTFDPGIQFAMTLYTLLGIIKATAYVAGTKIQRIAVGHYNTGESFRQIGLGFTFMHEKTSYTALAMLRLSHVLANMRSSTDITKVVVKNDALWSRFFFILKDSINDTRGEVHKCIEGMQTAEADTERFFLFLGKSRRFSSLDNMKRSEFFCQH
jgi:hypothetical protein